MINEKNNLIDQLQKEVERLRIDLKNVELVAEEARPAELDSKIKKLNEQIDYMRDLKMLLESLLGDKRRYIIAENLLKFKEMSIKQLADLSNLPPGEIHELVKLLEKDKLVDIIEAGDFIQEYLVRLKIP